MNKLRTNSLPAAKSQYERVTELASISACRTPWTEEFPPVLTAEQAAGLLQVPTSTIYHKRSEGRLDGTYCKVAGKLRFWRNKLLSRAFECGI